MARKKQSCVHHEDRQPFPYLMKTTCRIAHLSDLHFTQRQLLSSDFSLKSLLGRVNFHLHRKSDFDYHKLDLLPALFQSLAIDLVIVTGDLSTTSSQEEFQMAKNYLEKFQEAGIGVYVIPGNHDHYTVQAYQTKRFYQFFNPIWDATLPYSLSKDRLSVTKIATNWWLVGLDTAEATSIFQSSGSFHLECENALKKVLGQIPSHDHVMLINHFPLLEGASSRRTLKSAAKLQAIVSCYPQVKLYGFGHTHQPFLESLQLLHLPILTNPGCTPYQKKGGWNLIDLSSRHIHIGWYEHHAQLWNLKLERKYDLV